MIDGAKRVLLIEQEEDVRIGAVEVFVINGIACDGYDSLSSLPSNVDIDGYDLIISTSMQDIGKSRKLRYVKKPYSAKDLLDICVD